MKKKLEIYIYVTIITFFMTISLVHAAECNGIFTVEAATMIREGFELIGIAVPILLLVLGSFDMAGAVFSGDADAMKKSISKLTKRAIAAVLVFFVPLIVRLLLSIPAVKDSLNLVDDPTCGVVSGEN